MGSLTTLREHLGVPFEPELALKAEGSDVLRNTSDKETLWYHFLLMLLPYITQPLTLKTMMWKEREW